VQPIITGVFESLTVQIIKALYRGLYELYYLLFIKARLHRSLKKNHTYYQQLGRDQSEFARSVWEFIRENDFIPRDELRIGFKLKVIIASHAVQLSWRLSDLAYDYYEKIIIYREYYPSRLTNKLHKAEVNPGLKLIVFSVRAIHESLAREDDGINVLLHEFAHALWLEQLLMHKQYYVFHPQTFEAVRNSVHEQFTEISSNEEHLFRKYAFANEAEFFAVAVENFFERPDKFQSVLPKFYRLLTQLFRQNPLMIKTKNP
jgi:MtfA peptidase